jgi:hypothetical protein
MFDSLIRSAHTAARSLRVRSALNPMLWLTGIVTPICFPAAYVFRFMPTLCCILVGLGALPVLVTCAGFVFFAVKNPAKLQSEDYQIRHESLQLIQSKGGHIPLDSASITAIANPAAPALPPVRGQIP